MFDDLLTPEQVYELRKGKPIAKGETRVQEITRKRPLVKVTDADFKLIVWKRDKDRCRCCGRKVAKVLTRLPERGEVHHVHGRLGDLRFEPRAALLVCLACHERITGKVNDKLVIVPTKFFELNNEKYTDARAKVTFRKAA